jgi:hypothetical protein
MMKGKVDIPSGKMLEGCLRVGRMMRSARPATSALVVGSFLLLTSMALVTMASRGGRRHPVLKDNMWMCNH